MIDLWYINTKDVDPNEINRMINFLPENIANDIIRYKNHEDRCLKLFGKIIVQKYQEQLNRDFSWSNWSVSDKGKPFYTNGKRFNISHSGNVAAVAFSEFEVGIDIEKCVHIDITPLIAFLHEEERGYINDFGNSSDAFYRVWTRKEAYLKAKGIGIVEGLNIENCLQDNLGYDNEWFLTSLPIVPNYELAVCSQISTPTINILKLEASNFLQL
jgi:4'-phosphopantetheinyl transferase